MLKTDREHPTADDLARTFLPPGWRNALVKAVKSSFQDRHAALFEDARHFPLDKEVNVIQNKKCGIIPNKELVISPRKFQEQKDRALARMRERGLRLTAQRKAVLDYLFSTNEHPSARKIFENVRKSLPGIGLSTVYGILAELSRNGIIRALEFNEMDNRYEGNLEQHINLICLRCGKIYDYVTPYTVDLERIRDTARFQAFQSRFELYGICEACAGEE